jgi:protein-S-isoprenylcysteine O-methyltransferase Ste14
MDKEDKITKRKALSGFAWLIVIMGISLFAPAGTFDYWQAWVYLLIFGGSSMVITLFLMKRDMELLKRRLRSGASAEKERSQKTILSFARLFFVGLLVTPGFDHRFKLSDVPIYVSILGEIMVALGFFVVFLVFRENTFTSATIEIAENQKVISTGPYAVIRHPMYSGALLMLLFTPLALASYWDFLFFILIFITIVWRLLDEEKFLSKKLPGYPAYCQKTRFRLIPKIW